MVARRRKNVAGETMLGLNLDETRHLLIRSSNWLGDAVMTVPAVRRIKRVKADLKLSVLTKSNLAGFWETVAEVDEVISIRQGESVFQVARKLENKFEAALLLPNSPRTGLEVWLARIPQRAGYRRPWRNLFLNRFAPEPAKPRPLEHQVNHYLRLAEWCGANLDDPLPALGRRRPKELIAGVCPGAEYGPAKRWPDYASAVKKLSEELGLHWLILGTAKDHEFAEALNQALGTSGSDLTGKTSLSELIERLKECQFLLTNDTGTMHLAAHLGVPTVSIFGSTEPALTGPLGSGHVVLRHHVNCSPCFLRDCPLDFRCMKAVTVEEVVEAVKRVIAQTNS